MAAEHATLESIWHAGTGHKLDDSLLEWAPDVFALTEIVLDRSEAFRFVVSPPAGQHWPPTRTPRWNNEVAAAAPRWAAWGERGKDELPALVAEEWHVLRAGASTPLEEIADGRAWRLCEALLTLHALADEASAGMGVSVETAGVGGAYRARGRELLARTGSLARVPLQDRRVLPKVRTPPGGISMRSLSRYLCLRDARVDVVWHRAPARRPGTQPLAQHTNILLLPWPLTIHQTDFRPVAGSITRVEQEPFGLFGFDPAEPFDLDLVDRLLVAARDEVDSVDVVVLPETAVLETDLDELERVLARHRVTMLVAGVREPVEPGRLPANWVRISVWLGGRWWHYRQNKHHRWSLDESQIVQYHLGGALHPRARWWEAMEVPRRSVQFVELGEGIAVVSLVCEDLARLDSVSELLRGVGPTLVTTILLDGPQLASRWTARYASVLADDPGSAVLTLTSLGMVQRSRPQGVPASRVVALWKDPVHGLREIPLENGAQAVLLTASVDRAVRRCADGRWPVRNTADLFSVGVHQVRAADRGTTADATATPTRRPSALDTRELTILSAWAEAVADAVVHAPDRVDVVLADARAGAGWRDSTGIEQPSAELSRALDALARVVGMARDGDLTVEGVLAASGHDRDGDDEAAYLARRLLRSAIEARRTG